MRVLPLENEDINECWLTDKERFSYQGLNSAERLTKPMVKQGGEWKEVDWSVALDYVAHALRDVAKTHGGAAIGGLVSPHATLEEIYSGAETAARPGQREHRFPSAPERFLRRRQAPRHALAGHEDRRHRQSGSRAGGRLLPAQGPSADRPAPAPVGQEGRAGQRPAQRRRRPADQARGASHCRAFATACHLGGNRQGGRRAQGCGCRCLRWKKLCEAVSRRTALAKRRKRSRRAWFPAARVAKRGNPARQLRPAASAGGDPECAGPATGRPARRQIRLPR